MKSDHEYYKEMYLTMIRAAEVTINWLLDGKDPIWAAQILMQAVMDCENIYVNEEIPTAEQKALFNTIYQDFLYEKRK
ncbi:MAG: hypothetical protein IJD81_04990 [Oscillospiraceae bacterium]|nr:hypothetical protein [Oscillospiraceae bacterium]